MKFLFGHFKQEVLFCVLQDYQCIQAFSLGLKMPRVPNQYKIERKQSKSDLPNILEFKIQICIFLDLTDYARFLVGRIV